MTDRIWIGRMQRIPQKFNGHVPGFREAVAKIKSQQTDENILRLLVSALFAVLASNATNFLRGTF